MLTYNEYYVRMTHIQDALNTAVDHLVINTAGMNAKEQAFFIFGKYIQALAGATMPSFYVAKCACPIAILVHVMREFSKLHRFDFSLFDPESVEQDEELNEMWQHDYIEYTRMSAPVLVGAASSIVGSDSVMDIANIEYDFWCNCQAEHLAKYCVAHDIDIIKVVNMV